MRDRIAAVYGLTPLVTTGIEACYRSSWNGSFDNAKKVHTITFEDVIRQWGVQQGRCAITGFRMSFKKNSPRKASIDRIDSSKGYSPENIQWLCWRVNDMKSDFAMSDFIYWCKAIAAHN